MNTAHPASHLPPSKFFGGRIFQPKRTPADVAGAPRGAGQIKCVWPRLFWSSVSGVEFDESGQEDAFHGLVGVLSNRLAQVRFCRYRFCATGELKYRGAVGLGYRSTYKRTLFVNYKILLLKLYGLLKLKAKVAD
jgi:hypothetical protein